MDTAPARDILSGINKAPSITPNIINLFGIPKTSFIHLFLYSHVQLTPTKLQEYRGELIYYSLCNNLLRTLFFRCDLLDIMRT